MKKLALLTCLVATAVGVFSQEPQKPAGMLSGAQKTFEKMRTLADSLENRATTVRQTLTGGNLAKLILRLRTGRACAREMCPYKHTLTLTAEGEETIIRRANNAIGYYPVRGR